MNQLTLIDGNSIAHAAFHVMRDLQGPDGESTGALYGFITSLYNVLNEFPSHCAVAFDIGERPGNNQRDPRKALSADYKANRPPMDPDLAVQMDHIKDFLKIVHIPALQSPGIEADDILASLATQFHTVLPVNIVTRDKDLLQLCALTNVTVRLIGWTGARQFDAAGVTEVYGMTPAQIQCYKALAGDPSDNIKGVPGIGKVTAKKLIDAYGSYEGIIRAVEADTVFSRPIARRLREHMDEFKLSYDLAELRIYTINAPLESLARRPYNQADVDAFAERFGMMSLIS